ncbi:MAG: quinone oxidoreductase [Alphaproteobacteria bacterium]|nr:quinone oxidoreductase [Alphaproteobacteria bacterium]
MSKAIVIHKPGGPEALAYEERELPPPGPGEARVRHKAVGINYIDIYHRSGLYPVATPFTPGSEAAGVVEAVGEGVDHLRLGDHVCYIGPIGSYAEERNIPADMLIPVPEDISLEVAAASILKGLTVCYLLEMTAEPKPGETIVFHSAAGGVGQIAVQWAKSLGLRVIGTVGSTEKAAAAKGLGCDEVIDIRANPDFASKVRELTGGKGVGVVYDSVGRDTFEASLGCLRPRGLMVSFGNSSGPASLPNVGLLMSKGSLYLTRPTLFHYFVDRASSIAGSERLWDKLRSGAVSINIGQTWPLAEAGKAHAALAGRQTKGSTLLMP